MAVPKRRSSRSKQKIRAMSKRWKAPLLKSCPDCSAAVPGHIACPSCGTYRGRKVLKPAEIA
jgi:large subunit ribosomal protein L32